MYFPSFVLFKLRLIMKQNFIILFLLFSTITLVAQQKIEIVFDETEYDFGNIREEDGKVSHIFRFTNHGTAPFAIKMVTSSCGCTTPEWTKGPIPPRGTGSITVAYTAEGRPGPFHKGVTVIIGSSSGDFTETLDIKGYVSPKQQPLSESYPYNLGNVLFRSTIIPFGMVTKGKSPERQLEIANGTNEPLKLVLTAPKHIVVQAPALIKPNEEIAITFKYLSNHTNKWAYVDDEVNVSVNDKTVGKLNVRANIQEDFSTLSSKERMNAPVATLSAKKINLGKLKIGSKYRGKLSLKNSGIDPLIVRAVVAESSYMKGSTGKSTLKGGKSTDIKIEVDATKLQPFTFSKTVEIITNDPTNPIITVGVEWQTVR